MKNRPWYEANGIPGDVLKAIEWDAYIDKALSPYPVECLDTPKNRELNERWKKAAAKRKSGKFKCNKEIGR